MGGTELLCILLFVIAYAAVSKWFESSVITPTMVFVGFGMLMGAQGFGVLGLDPEGSLANALAEVTLVLVLFSDAARIDLRVLRRELGLPVRLLGIGLPLTIVLGAAVAAVLFPSWSLAEALLLGAILAPTDAALGQAVVSSPAVPQRIRQALNVESGLNDGIALPVVLAALAAAGGDGARTGADWVAYAAQQIGLGPVAGVAIGWGGAGLLRAVTARGWINESFYRLSGLALALLCYAGAEAIGGNGFIAAFVGGLVFGNTARGMCQELYGFLEAEGQLLMLLIFMLLGSALAWPALAESTPAAVLYAVLSLTLVRMLPVALSVLGIRMRPLTTIFLGWFGPRGLASLLYGLLILEGAGIARGDEIFNVVILTVLLSVLLHGLTSVPGARLYGRAISAGRHVDAMEHEAVTPHPLRHGTARDAASEPLP